MRRRVLIGRSHVWSVVFRLVDNVKTGQSEGAHPAQVVVVDLDKGGYSERSRDMLA